MFEVTLPFPEESVVMPSEVPVFPLESMALLPGEPMPLRIFEERYKIMTEHALSDGKFIAIAGIQSGNSLPYSICGLGRIAMEEKLKDGCFNLVLVGIKRIKVRSYSQRKPYLKGEIEILEDTFSQTAVSVINSLSEQVYDLGRQVLAIRKKSQKDVSYADLESLPYDLLPLGMLCDLFSAALSLPHLEKQMILEETDAVRRAEKLIFTLRFELEKQHSSQIFFPSTLQ